MAVVSCSDTPPVFEATEETLDDVSTAVYAPVERIGRPARCRGGNDGFDVVLCQPGSQAIGIIGFVGEQAPRRRYGAEQWNGHGDIGDIAWCQRDCDRPAAIIGQTMDFAGPAAPRAADRLFVLPLFAPAAERCAFT
jgi:hypothetical protein